jgi:hypothetical protein
MENSTRIYRFQEDDYEPMRTVYATSAPPETSGDRAKKVAMAIKDFFIWIYQQLAALFSHVWSKIFKKK